MKLLLVFGPPMPLLGGLVNAQVLQAFVTDHEGKNRVELPGVRALKSAEGKSFVDAEDIARSYARCELLGYPPVIRVIFAGGHIVFDREEVMIQGARTIDGEALYRSRLAVRTEVPG